jgi:GTP diphosphokinase / guanosine-3',5'-bis(diphosphate) 3'-diphosphatase
MNTIPQSTLAFVLKAVQFAVRAHGSQKRKASGVPYITHPVDVAEIIVNEAGCFDPATLAAAILHDVVEDTAVTAGEIEREFGAKVAGIVLEVSDDKALRPSERKREQIRKFPALSYEACMVKMADKISNLRDQLRNPIPSWSIERIRGYAAWCYSVVFEAAVVAPPAPAAAAAVQSRHANASPVLALALHRIIDAGEFVRDGKTYALRGPVTEQEYYDIVDGVK